MGTLRIFGFVMPRKLGFLIPDSKWIQKYQGMSTEPENHGEPFCQRALPVTKAFDFNLTGVVYDDKASIDCVVGPQTA